MFPFSDSFELPPTVVFPTLIAPNSPAPHSPIFSRSRLRSMVDSAFSASPISAKPTNNFCNFAPSQPPTPSVRRPPPPKPDHFVPLIMNSVGPPAPHSHTLIASFSLSRFNSFVDRLRVQNSPLLPELLPPTPPPQPPNQLQKSAGPRHKIRIPRAQKNDTGEGCRCKRAKCAKKYCECFASGRSCGAACHCVHCLNP